MSVFNNNTDIKKLFVGASYYNISNNQIDINGTLTRLSIDIRNGVYSDEYINDILETFMKHRIPIVNKSGHICRMSNHSNTENYRLPNEVSTLAKHVEQSREVVDELIDEILRLKLLSKATTWNFYEKRIIYSSDPLCKFHKRMCVSLNAKICNESILFIPKLTHVRMFELWTKHIELALEILSFNKLLQTAIKLKSGDIEIENVHVCRRYDTLVANVINRTISNALLRYINRNHCKYPAINSVVIICLIMKKLGIDTNS